MLKRLAAVFAILISATLLWALPSSAGPEVTARAVIPGCQNIGMDDSVPPFPPSVIWQPAENGHDYGSYRISSGCGQQLTARLRGIGPDSNGREAIMFLHVQRSDGSWYRTSTVHARTGQGAVKVAGMLPVNHRFYMHCADAIAQPQENQPCRLTFTF
jgi:hypothetical protein